MWRWALRNPLPATFMAATAVMVLTFAIGASVAALRIAAARRLADGNLVKQFVAAGGTLAEEGDLFGALPWFAEALRQEESDPGRARMHGLRLATTLRQCPKPSQIWFHDAEVLDAQFSPDCSRVITACRDGKARVFDAETGDRLFVLEHAHPVNVAAFSRDGRLVVTGSGTFQFLGETYFQIGAHWPTTGPTGVNAGSARVWDAATGRALTPLLEHPCAVLHAAFSPDGRFVATVGGDELGRIWEVSTGKLSATLAGHSNQITRVEFDPTGRHLVTCSMDNSIQLWRAGTWERGPRLELTPPLSAVFLVRVAP